MTPILILAAGRSTRMRGTDKLAEPVNGVPLLRDRAVTALAAGGPVFVALPALDHPRAALLSGLPVTLLAVPEAATGMAASLRGAVAQLPECRRFLMLLADMPDITRADIKTVLEAADFYPENLIWRGATTAGKPGHPILFDAALRPEFAGLTGDTGGRAIVSAHADRTRLVPLPGDHALRDLDTPEDWAAWRAETAR